MTLRISDALATERDSRQANSRWRQLRIHTRGERLNFSSNDYLGLSQHPTVVQAYCDALQHWGAGSGGSPLVTGFQPPHQYLTKQLAEWLERDSVLLFSSGFAANQSVMKVCGHYYDAIVADRLIHASLIDGLRATKCGWRRFPHNELDKALTMIGKSNGHALLVTESIFSMDGDEVDWQALREVAAAADVFVDDAHGLGVAGSDGRSAAAAMSQAELPLLTVTFGKAIGVAGAAVAAPQSFIDELTNSAREFIYSTAPSAAQAAAVSAAISVVQSTEGEQLRHKLNENIHAFRCSSSKLGLSLLASNTAIQGLLVGDDQRAVQISQALQAIGIDCVAIRPPTVPEGSARLRITITAQHTNQQIDYLAQELARYAT